MITFNKKKKFFKQKIRDVQYSIFEFEFKIFKARQMREDARLLRDRSVENVAQVEARLKVSHGDEKKKLQDELTIHQNNVAAYEGQMRLIDEQINGVEGQPGLLETIKGLTELKSMYRDYIR